MYHEKSLQKENFLREGPAIKYQPKYNYLMKKESSATIGNSVRIDEKLINPLKGRSPGPK